MDGRYMETNLYEYGIFDEVSDIRAHVASNKIIYVFKTKNCVSLLKEQSFKQVHAYQPGYDYPTAKGYLVKPNLIEDMRQLKYISWNGWEHFSEDWDTTMKGKFAVRCVLDLLKDGRFPLWIEAKQTNDIKIDISGTDILLVMDKKIQVKCDWPAGKTGNLYIQTHEINPLKKL